MTKRYLAIYRHLPSGQGPGNLSGIVPDVPGCGSIGHSMVEMRENLHDALELHLEELMRKGKPLPEPSVGLEDVTATGIAEWLVVRLRVGGSGGGSRYAMCRPCPGR